MYKFIETTRLIAALGAVIGFALVSTSGKALHNCSDGVGLASACGHVDGDFADHDTPEPVEHAPHSDDSTDCHTCLHLATAVMVPVAIQPTIAFTLSEICAALQAQQVYASNTLFIAGPRAPPLA